MIFNTVTEYKKNKKLLNKFVFHLGDFVAIFLTLKRGFSLYFLCSIYFKLIFEQALDAMQNLISVFLFFYTLLLSRIKEMNNKDDGGFQLKQFHKFRALINKIKILGPHMKQVIKV